jgi:hypothetical protein
MTAKKKPTTATITEKRWGWVWKDGPSELHLYDPKREKLAFLTQRRVRVTLTYTIPLPARPKK